MRKGTGIGAILAAAWLAGVACTVHQDKTPGLTGPSELALALSVTATPDSVALDGSQAAVVVEARDPNGGPRVGLPLRLDILVGQTFEDCGTLSSRNVVTGQDGRAISVFTAPSMPLPFPNCLNFAPGNSVTIMATPTGADASTTTPRLATIRMVPPGSSTILPPAPTPVAAFTFFPVAPAAGVPVVFNAATSCGGPLAAGGVCNSVSQLVSYTWSFGDGTTTTVTTPSVPHTYFSQQAFVVMLTVTNDRGVSASTSQTVPVAAPTVPTAANFTISPSPASINTPVVLDASSTVTAPGVSITDYAWVFGDGTGIFHTTNKTVSHVYATAGVFAISLTVTDNIGTHTAAVTKSTTVTISAVVGLPTAVFTIDQSPATVGIAITVEGNGPSPSTPSAGAAGIVRYEWDFGDGSGIVSVTSPTTSATHTYGAAGSYIITLTVTDTAGKQASANRIIVVQ